MGEMRGMTAEKDVAGHSLSASPPVPSRRKLREFDLPEDRDYATVAGHALWLMKRLPEVGDHVDDQGFLIFLKNLRADRYLQGHMGAAGACAVSAHAMDAGAALEMLLKRKSMSVFSPLTASTQTSPPRPPSPPSGPPNSTNFSRRKDTAPAPPSPERI